MACAFTVAGYEHAGYDLQGVCCAFIPGQGLGGFFVSELSSEVL